MKPTSILFAFLVGLVFFIFLPYIFTILNVYFSFPVYSNPILKLMGVVLFLSGVLFVIYSTKLFIILGKGTPIPVEPPKKLVVKGIYKYSRNPIYLGYFLIFLGYFFFFGHLSLLIYFILTFIGINLLVIYHEEPILEKRFGEDYIQYLQKTPRWI